MARKITVTFCGPLSLLRAVEHALRAAETSYEVSISRPAKAPVTRDVGFVTAVRARGVSAIRSVRDKDGSETPYFGPEPTIGPTKVTRLTVLDEVD